MRNQKINRPKNCNLQTNLRFIKKPEIMKTLALLPFLFFAFHLNAQETDPKNIKETSVFEGIQLFPNPTSEIIFIRNGEMIDSYQIFDFHGRIVQSGVSNAQIISLIDMPIGYYFIEIKIGTETKRVKIQKY